MADEPSRTISAKEIATLNAWIARHTSLHGPVVCPVCRHSTWTVVDKVVEARPFTGGNMILGGPIYPLVMIMCTTCAYLFFFNAILTGVLPQDAPKKTDGI